MEIAVYTQNGKQKGSIQTAEAVFGHAWNADLVHHVITSIQANMRRGTAHTKDRGDVRGGGRKPWRQKGTGRARHGSIRSPLWGGGGVTHGPRTEKTYAKKINKKERLKALYVLLSQKARDGQVFGLDTLTLSEPKTREAKKVLDALGTIDGYTQRRQNEALIIVDSKDDTLHRAFANIGNVRVRCAETLSALDSARYRQIVFVDPENTIGIIEKRRGVREKESV